MLDISAAARFMSSAVMFFICSAAPGGMPAPPIEAAIFCIWACAVFHHERRA